MGDVARGDLDALGMLFSRHHARVHALCYRFQGDAAAADDLVQESFLRVLRYGKSFDARSRFTTWLYRLVRNVCLDHMSRNQREHGARLSIARDLEPRAPAQAERDERLERVHQALQRLPAEQREVLVLSRFENLKYREIAEPHEITVDAVKQRAHRALRELRRIFEELERQA